MIVVVCCLPGAAICLMSSFRTSNSALLRILFKRWLSLEHFFLTSALRISLWSGAFQAITWSNRCFRMSNCCSLFVWKKSDVIMLLNVACISSLTSLRSRIFCTTSSCMDDHISHSPASTPSFLSEFSTQQRKLKLNVWCNTWTQEAKFKSSKLTGKLRWNCGRWVGVASWTLLSFLCDQPD